MYRKEKKCEKNKFLFQKCMLKSHKQQQFVVLFVFFYSLYSEHFQNEMFMKD